MTLQLSDRNEMPSAGDSAVFFTEALAFGDTLSVVEIDRRGLEAVRRT